jgi:hypothetical protein
MESINWNDNIFLDLIFPSSDEATPSRHYFPSDEAMPSPQTYSQKYIYCDLQCVVVSEGKCGDDGINLVFVELKL